MSTFHEGPSLGADFFRGRREAFFEAIGEGAIAVVEGAGPPPTSSGRFRQSSHFYYLTGFSEPSAVAVFLWTETERSFTLFVPPHDATRERWDGPRAGVEGATADYGADEAYPVEALEKELAKRFRKAGRTYLAPNVETKTGRTIFEVYQSIARTGGEVGHGAYELRDVGWVLAQLRVQKTDEELAMMRHAAAITREAYAQAVPKIAPGRWEYEIEATLDYSFRALGGDGPAYTSIVGGGANATVLHYIENGQPLKDGELLLIDAGASYGHYACDVTRTYPINGRFTPEQRAVYEAVLHAQKTVIDAIKVGATIRDLHRLATLTLIEGMKTLGWLPDKPPETLLNEEAHRPFFMHGIGHYLGLDTHDVGPTKVGKEPYPLKPGVVLTVEPGLYVPPDAEDVPDAFKGIGVRIEDDVLITETGIEVLTTGIPKEIEDVEALVGGR